MFANLYDALVLVLFFGFTIFVHEFGHFLAARRAGMLIDTFSIGFGPAIWKKKIRGTVYKIGIIPIGGYVALPQLDPSSMELIQGKSEGSEKDGKAEEKAEFRDIPPISASKKIFVSLAGAAGNMLLAVVLAWVIYLSPEVTAQKMGAFVGSVATNSPAYERGLRPGDQILSVNKEPVTTWNEFFIECHLKGGTSNELALVVRSNGRLSTITLPTTKKESGIQVVEGIDKAMLCVVMKVFPDSPAKRAGLETADIVKEFGGTRVTGPDHFILLVAERKEQETPITVDRKGKLVNLTVKPAFDQKEGRTLVGVKVSPGIEGSAMPWMEYKKPMDQIKGDARGIIRILRALVSRHEAGQAAGALGGPVMIITTLWISIKISMLNAVGFMRFLGVNLAILNLLPIPVLDGGHIVFALWEGITHRRAHPKLVSVLVNTFASLLIAAILILTFRDFLSMPRLIKAFNKMRKIEEAQKANRASAGPTNAPAMTNSEDAAETESP